MRCCPCAALLHACPPPAADLAPSRRQCAPPLGCTTLPLRPQVREESGINSFADVAALLEAAPKPLLDSLRLGTVVRHSGGRRTPSACVPLAGLRWRARCLHQRSWATVHSAASAAPPVCRAATLLGATIGDRLRVNARWARSGMLRSDEGGPLEFVGALQSRVQRWRLALHIAVLRLAFWVSAAVRSAAGALLPALD